MPMEAAPLKRFWPAPAAAALSLVVYLQTLCPTVYVEGSGELIGATYLLGTPHPTGYPLFCLLGRLIAVLLPLSSPALEVNAASAFTGALAVGAVAALLVQRGCLAWISMGAALAFAFSSTFWSQVVVAEVYGLSTLAAAGVMCLGLGAADRAGGRDERWLVLTAYVAGLGVTTHLNHLLILPGLVGVLAWRWYSHGGLRAGTLARRLPKLMTAAALGYSLILYLPLRNGRGSGFHWGDLDTPRQLWDHVNGALYRSAFFSLPLEGILLNAQRLWQQFSTEFSPLLIPVVAWGIWVAARTDRFAAVVVGSGVALNLFLATSYHRDPNGLGVFFLPAFLGAAIFLGFGLDSLARRLTAAVASENAPRLVGLLAALVVLTGNAATADRSGNRIAHTYGSDILAGLPPRAILITEGDTASYVLDYLWRVEGMRPDVLLYNRMGRGTDLLSRDERSRSPGIQARVRWQRERELIESGEEGDGTATDAGARPVYYLIAREMPTRGFRFVPAGLCYRVEPVQERREGGAAADPGSDDAGDGGEKAGSSRRGAVAAASIDLSAALERDLFRDPWVRKIQANYWFMRGEQLNFQGSTAAAEAAFDSAAALAFDSRSTRYNIALKFYKNNKFEKAKEHLKAAVALDPTMPGTERLAAAIKRRQGRHYRK